MRRGVGSRRDRRAGPPSAASALGVSGGGCARSTKHAEKKRGWARVQRGVVARALPVADRRGHAPGGDRKPAALERSPLSAGEVCLLCSHRRARASAHEPAWQARLLRRAMSATPGSRALRAATVVAASGRPRATQQPGRSATPREHRDGQQQREERTRRQKLIRDEDSADNRHFSAFTVKCSKIDAELSLESWTRPQAKSEARGHP